MIGTCAGIGLQHFKRNNTHRYRLDKGRNTHILVLETMHVAVCYLLVIVIYITVAVVRALYKDLFCLHIYIYMQLNMKIC